MTGSLWLLTTTLLAVGQTEGPATAPYAGGYATSGGIDAYQPSTTAGAAAAPARGPTVLFPESYPERLYDFVDFYRKKWHFPISFAAWHWQHQNNDGPLQSGYGIQGLRGTYWWNIFADPEIPVEWGPVSKVGMHMDLRLREQDQFRTFFNEKVWFWELYTYADTNVGRFKAGQIWKRLGIDWDGVFFGNVPYFDGFKLDPDIGVSWENTWKVRDNLKVASFVQFFLHEDSINGSVAGGDPESVTGSNERNTGVVRVVPTWTLPSGSTLALGLSGSVGQIANDPIVGVDDQILSIWAIDLTFTRKKFKVFGEILQSHGVLNPQRFTSGGPSNRTTDLLVGVQYQLGPANFRFSYSAGFDENPAGWQQLWLPGVLVALTKNVDLYIEWTRWDIFNNSTAPVTRGHVEFEDGFSFVINWRF